MMRQFQQPRGVRLAWRDACASTWACLALLAPSAGWAAEAPAAAAPEASAQEAAVQLQEVVVTGSRIAQPELKSVAPIEVVSSASIESAGTINIADVMRDLPAVGTPALSTLNSNFLTGDNGISTLNLRNLGDQRTLVLVNGRRMTPGVSGTGDVDLNTIPTEFIDRIEIVTGGASAIYGSDAVAGVVNFILKKNFEGLEFMGQTGKSGSGDAGTDTMGVLFGSSFADSRGHIMLNVSHDKENGLRSTQRRLSAVDMFVTPGGLINPQFSSYIPQGNFFVNSSAGGFGDAFSFTPDGSLIDGALGPGYNRSSQRFIEVPVERTLAASTLSYDLTEHHHAYAELTYADTSARSNIEPLPLASNNVNGIYGTSTDANGDAIGMPITNAYLQTLPALAPIVAEINAWNATGSNCVGSAATNPAYDCIHYINFRRRLTDIADRTNDDERQLHRIVMGVRGDLPFGDWAYDASYVYGRSTTDQVSTGSVNLINFQESLNSIVSGGKIVCADPVAQSLGCVPVNVFGTNSITPAAAQWLAAAATRNVDLSEEVVSGSISGSIGTLPAGSASLVLGTEFRKDKSSEIHDPLTNLGLNGSNLLPDTIGSFSVKEGFAEADVPILKDLPAFNALDLNAAYRRANYSTSGGVDAWKVGINWAVIPDVRFRAVYSRAVRAANIGELFGGQSQTFVSVNDPCDGISATSNGNTTQQLAAACRAIPAIAAAIAGGNTFAYTALERQNEFGLLGSNANLAPEHSQTKTFGIVLTPRGLPGFATTIDYFDIKIDNAVATLNQDIAAQNCLATGEAVFCDNIIRNPNTGKITEFLAFNQNIGYIRSAGVDTAIRYRFNLPRGNLSVSLAETHQLKLEQSVPGAPVEVDLGQLNSSGRLGDGFKDRATLNFDYTLGGLDATWRVRYLGKVQDTTAANGIIFQPFNDVPAFWYNDAQLRYTWGLREKDTLTAYVGANNVFNKQPPFLPQGMASNVIGTSTDTNAYDVIGIFWYAGVRLKF